LHDKNSASLLDDELSVGAVPGVCQQHRLLEANQEWFKSSNLCQ
jgi:hypothetical protein